jgi:hypothetical protein
MENVTIQSKPDPYDDWRIVQRVAGEFFVGKMSSSMIGALAPYYSSKQHLFANGGQIGQANVFEAGMCESLPITPGDAVMRLNAHANAKNIIAQIENCDAQRRAAASGIALVGAKGAPPARRS